MSTSTQINAKSRISFDITSTIKSKTILIVQFVYSLSNLVVGQTELLYLINKLVGAAACVCYQ